MAALSLCIASVLLAGPAQDDKRPRLADDVMPPGPGQRTLSGGWPVGSTIDVYFKNGSAARRTQFARAASEWSKYGNFLLRFHQEQMPNNVYAVLVAFWDGGGVSLLGSGTYSNQHPSIYVPYNPMNSPVDAHEFGHTLGLVHEFENPDSLRFITVTENTYKILQDGLGWDRQTADARLIKKVVPAGKEHAFDPVSCMGYQSEYFLPGLYNNCLLYTSRCV